MTGPQLTSPQLLYHSASAPLYPTNDPSLSLLAVRFSAPVRISSVRIAPEGVGCISGIGCTYPAYWSGQLFLNVSGDGTASAIGPASNPGSTSVDARGTPLPPNALATTLLEYDEKNGDGWEVDYPVDMPEGVTTRLITLLAPIERITLSIYGYPTDSTTTASAPSESHALPITPQTAQSMASSVTLDGDQSQSITVEQEEKKKKDEEDDEEGTVDTSWLYTWAGPSPSALLDLLSSTSNTVRERAMDCLDLLIDNDPSILNLLSSHANLSRCFASPRHPLVGKLLERQEWLDRADLRDWLPKDGWLVRLVDGSEEERRTAAWALLSDQVDAGDLGTTQRRDQIMAGLNMLSKIGAGDIHRNTSGRSRQSTLVGLCESWSGDADEAALKSLRLGTEVLAQVVKGLGESREDRVARSYMARKLPPLLVAAHTRASLTSLTAGSDAVLPFPRGSTNAHEVLRALLVSSTQSTCGSFNMPLARKLAQPYLAALDPADPLVTAFTQPAPPNDLDLPTTTAEERHILRFATHLSSPVPATNGIQHALTPGEILSVLAPSLLAQLANAPVPLFGIQSSVPESNLSGLTSSFPQSTTSASAYGGKVYTSHEFRSRAAASPIPTVGVKANQGFGMGMAGANMGMSTGYRGAQGMMLGGCVTAGMNPGLAVGVGGVGARAVGARAASKHVDEFGG